MGLWRRLREFNWQAYGIGSLGLAAVGLLNIGNQFGIGTHSWTPLLFAALVNYYAVARMLLIRPEQFTEVERLAIRRTTSVAAVSCLAVLEWMLLPVEYLGLGWLVLAAPHFEFGLRRRLNEFRYEAYAVGLLALYAARAVHLAASASQVGPAGCHCPLLAP